MLMASGHYSRGKHPGMTVLQLSNFSSLAQIELFPPLPRNNQLKHLLGGEGGFCFHGYNVSTVSRCDGVTYPADQLFLECSQYIDAETMGKSVMQCTQKIDALCQASSLIKLHKVFLQCCRVGVRISFVLS